MGRSGHCFHPPRRPRPTSSKPILSAVFLGAEMNRESCTGGCFTEGKKAGVTGVPGPHLLSAPSMTRLCPRSFTPATFLPRESRISVVTAQAVGASRPLFWPKCPEDGGLSTHIACPEPNTEPGKQQSLHSYRGSDTDLLSSAAFSEVYVNAVRLTLAAVPPNVTPKSYIGVATQEENNFAAKQDQSLWLGSQAVAQDDCNLPSLGLSPWTAKFIACVADDSPWASFLSGVRIPEGTRACQHLPG